MPVTDITTPLELDEPPPRSGEEAISITIRQRGQTGSDWKGCEGDYIVKEVIEQIGLFVVHWDVSK